MLIVAIVAVAVGVTALVKMSAMAANGQYIYGQNLMPITYLTESQYALEEAKVDAAQYVLNMDRPAKQPERTRQPQGRRRRDRQGLRRVHARST